MSEKKGDVFDSVAKTGGVAAAGILGSVFFPAIVSSSIDGWLKEQMAANPNALVFSCILAAIAGWYCMLYSHPRHEVVVGEAD